MYIATETDSNQLLPSCASSALSGSVPNAGWVRFVGIARVSENDTVVIAPNAGGSLLLAAMDTWVRRAAGGSQIFLRQGAPVTVLERPAEPAVPLPAHLVAIGGCLISTVSGRVVGPVDQSIARM